MATKTYGPKRINGIKKWTGSNGLSGYWELSKIPVDVSTNTPVTLARLVTDTLATDDLLDIEAWARVTNNTGHLPHDSAGADGYTIGVGWYMKAYEYTDPGEVNELFAVESMNGENVTPNGLMHHMPMHWSGLYQVPAAYNGKRLVLMFRADAHSTAARPGDWIDVDQGYGRFTVTHLKTDG